MRLTGSPETTGEGFSSRVIRPALGVLPPSGRVGSPVGEVWDACAAHGKVGPVMGLRPLRGPPCIPPEAPPGKVFSFLGLARARGFSCGSFLPSLRSLR